jgi:hypothetical protein
MTRALHVFWFAVATGMTAASAADGQAGAEALVTPPGVRAAL